MIFISQTSNFETFKWDGNKFKDVGVNQFTNKMIRELNELGFHNYCIMSSSVTKNRTTLKSVFENIKNSSIVITILNDSASSWQKWQMKIAVKLAKPILGIIPDDGLYSIDPIFDKYSIPKIGWNAFDAARIISGSKESFSYQIGDNKLNILRVDFDKINFELINYLIKRPIEIHNVTPRKYEELIAFLLDKYGFEVTLTQQTRDNGVDIFALKKTEIGSFLTIVDCKKYKQDNPIGIEIVRGLYGTMNLFNASHSMIATTSHFTSGARILEKKYEYQISLKDHIDIFNWMKNLT